MNKWLLGLPAAALGALAASDLTQTRNPVLRTFPVLGHARGALTAIGPELRQYIVASNDEERPFTRDQRNWIYESANGEQNTFGFGTDNDVEFAEGYPIIKHRTFAKTVATGHPRSGKEVPLPAAKILGGARGRREAFRPKSVINVSAMSYGSLSGNAVESLNRGCGLADALQNTGEGGLSPFHRKGGELIFQIGTGYFGVRDDDGRFDLDKLLRLVEENPVRALEIKLSQGAKPGLGGLLPGAKVTRQIADVRKIQQGQDCVSPTRHTAFDSVDSMLDFVEMLAERTGLPVGVKSAIGHTEFWDELTETMAREDRGVDFVTIDGGEGGTGAAPLVFADAVSLPFRLGFSRVYSTFARAGLTDDVLFIGSGKLGIPENAAVAFALGVDMVNVAREGMLSIGCIQAQKCHTGNCPTGVATQNKWLERGVDPDANAVRASHYLKSVRRDLLKLAGAVGVVHPGLITPDDIEIVTGTRTSTPLAEIYGYEPGWGLPGRADVEQITSIMVDAGDTERDAADTPPEVVHEELEIAAEDQR